MKPFLIRSIALAAILTLTACASNTQKDVGKQEKLAHIHYQLGIDALGKEGMLPKAFDELIQSNEIHPNQPPVLDALAYAWLLRGDMKKSEQYYKLALRHGGRAASQNNYANLLNRMQRFDEAEAMARKSLDDPRYANQDLAFINLGDALLGQKKFDQAIKAYSQARLFNQNSLLPESKLANAYFVQGRLHESATLYKILLRKQPNSRSTVNALVEVLIKQNREAEARLQLQEFRRSSNSSLDKAWAMDKIGQLD